jgi:hypothetical protein
MREARTQCHARVGTPTHVAIGVIVVYLRVSVDVSTLLGDLKPKPAISVYDATATYFISM